MDKDLGFLQRRLELFLYDTCRRIIYLANTENSTLLEIIRTCNSKESDSVRGHFLSIQNRRKLLPPLKNVAFSPNTYILYHFKIILGYEWSNMAYILNLHAIENQMHTKI